MMGQLLSEGCKLKQLQRSRQLLEMFPSECEKCTKQIWFTDEDIYRRHIS